MRERLLLLRRDVERLAVVPVDFAEPVERLAVLRLAAGLRAAEARVAPPVDALAREVDEPDDVARLAVERFAVLRFAVERLAVDLRAPLLRDEPEEEDEAPRPELLPSSALHLPDITRCAASATASAMSEPNLVALAIMFVAACDAVSAASRPASRILRRAEGLALIAAAAAARPAASISLLIAALANLSTVSDLLDEERDELFLADFAIDLSPCVAMKLFSAVTVPE